MTSQEEARMQYLYDLIDHADEDWDQTTTSELVLLILLILGIYSLIALINLIIPIVGWVITVKTFRQYVATKRKRNQIG